jgi:aminoglycoside phosphotransferase (APT) family kinase protein
MAEIPGHKVVDEHAIRAKLTPWFHRQLQADEVEIAGVDVPRGQGFSSETWLLDVVWTEEGDDHRQGFVAKTRPTGDTIFPTYDLASQFHCMRLVREHSEVPAAPVRWLEEDPAVVGRPFYVMDRVDGRVPPDNLPYTMEGWVLDDLQPVDRRQLVERSLDVLVGLHRLDAEQCGFGFLDRPRHGPTGVAQQLGEWEAYLRWVMGDRTHEVGEAALARLRATLPESPPPTVLNWGDSRIGNIIFDHTEPVAVLDWEMAALGPPEVDVGWFLYMHRFFTEALGVADPEGWPSEEDQLAHYEQGLGRSVDDLGWYLLFGGFRYGMIMVRIIQIQEATGIDAGWTEDENLAIAHLATML